MRYKLCMLFTSCAQNYLTWGCKCSHPNYQLYLKQAAQTTWGWPFWGPIDIRRTQTWTIYSLIKDDEIHNGPGHNGFNRLVFLSLFNLISVNFVQQVIKSAARRTNDFFSWLNGHCSRTETTSKHTINQTMKKRKWLIVACWNVDKRKQLENV